MNRKKFGAETKTSKTMQNHPRCALGRIHLYASGKGLYSCAFNAESWPRLPRIAPAIRMLAQLLCRAGWRNSFMSKCFLPNHAVMCVGTKWHTRRHPIYRQGKIAQCIGVNWVAWEVTRDSALLNYPGGLWLESASSPCVTCFFPVFPTHTCSPFITWLEATWPLYANHSLQDKLAFGNEIMQWQVAPQRFLEVSTKTFTSWISVQTK